ncbi:4-amino-4-deoxy-L-arabinose transferase [Pseudomonas oryzihabitans]|uniref:phospholipid carrier-dependent glycosyltransferase n=1 Tax=Pseudomonas oryzihabitans TaxID=47885 RepID=UPI0005C831D4|nr:phospholipid carrier-dependent glycosyltransferase [Pseudomonas oryzihabitans]KIZ50100.1 4-amino-4-deoxy-L-arabinose transferase [Pseudomonas oryzihabitans]
MSRVRLLFLLPVALLAYVLPLNWRGLWIPDESRYAQIGQELWRSGDWVVPHFLGLPYFEKPIGGYWTQAIAQALLGDSLLSVRLVPLLAGFATAALVVRLTRLIWGDRQLALLAGVLYLSCLAIAASATYVTLDAQFAFWTTLSLLALWQAQAATTLGVALRNWALLGLACGCGLLTKGFLALVLPVLVALPFFIWQRRLLELICRGPVAVIVAALVVAPWALWVAQRDGDYWNFFFWHEHIQRFASDDAQHERPFWFYGPILLVAILPWTGLLPRTLGNLWQQRSHTGTAFLGITFISQLIFFSLSRGKLPTYLLPAMAALVPLIARAAFDAYRTGQWQALRLNGGANLLLGILGLGALLMFDDRLYGRGDNLAWALALLAPLGFILAGLGALLWPRQTALAPALAIWLVLPLLTVALPKGLVYNKLPSVFVQEQLRKLNPAHLLVSNDLGVAASMAWATRRSNVVIVGGPGELKYGFERRPDSGRLLDDGELPNWIEEHRRDGSIAVLLRMSGDSDDRLLASLPATSDKVVNERLILLVYPRTAR